MRISDWSSDVCSSDLPAGAKARHSKTKGPLMRTALITGATAGIGEAAARAFVDAGWRVIGTGRRRARLDALAGGLEIGEAGGRGRGGAQVEIAGGGGTLKKKKNKKDMTR